MKYTANFTNGYCIGDFVCSNIVSGLSLDENHYKMPDQALKELKKLSEVNHNPATVRLKLTITFEKETLPEKLRKYFMHEYSTKIRQYFKGSDPCDQRPAVTAGELFKLLLPMLSGKLEKFKIIQYDYEPLAQIEANISDTDDPNLISEILDLLGY